MAAFSLYDLQPDLPRIKVLDIGAAADNPSFPPPYAALLAAGHVEVTGFEPRPESCARLNEQYGPPHRFLPLFIGTGGPAKFYQTAFADCASLYKPNTAVLQLFNHMPEVMALVAVSDVQTTRLDDVAEIDDVDFLTIDVQGAELDVLNGAAIALMGAVVVQIEAVFVELYEAQPLFGDIDSHLRRRDFWFHTFIDTNSLSFKPLIVGSIDQGLNQRIWSDAVYMRHPLRLATLPPVKLRKMAIILHDIYRSYDIALVCLAAADAGDGGALAPRYRERLSAL